MMSSRLLARSLRIRGRRSIAVSGQVPRCLSSSVPSAGGNIEGHVTKNERLRALHGSSKNEDPLRGSSKAQDQKQPWQAMNNIDIQRVTQQAMLRELTMQQSLTLEAVVPWFLENMPQSYFGQVPESFRMDHIKAIAAIKEANMELYLNLKSHTPDGRTVLTFIRPGTDKGMLMKLVKEIPFTLTSKDYQPLSRAMVFSTADEAMSLSVFIFGEQKNREKNDVVKSGSRILAYAQTIQSINESRSSQQEMIPAIKSLSSLTGPGDFSIHQPRPSPLFERENLINYFHRCSRQYLEKTRPRRFLRHRELFERVSGSEGTGVLVEEFVPSLGDQDDHHTHHLGSRDAGAAGAGTSYWVNVAVANSIPQQVLENTSRLLALHDFDVMTAHLDLISDGDNGEMVMLRVRAAPVKGTAATDETFQLLTKELKRCKWLDPQTMDLVFDTYPWLGVLRGEIITAFCAMLHPVMSKKNALIYSKANIFDMVTNPRNIVHAASIADLFLDAFNPERPSAMSKEEFQNQCQTLREKIDTEVEDTAASELLLKMIDFVSCTLKTNIYVEDRYALGLRLDPRAMVAEGEEDKESPFGTIFVHGRRFNAYHVRFRDISRGGMRLVTPRTLEQHALESAHQYDECYGLAFAQQLKNKDIPEGGSKAVNLIDVVGFSESGKNFVMRKSVKAFTDTVLDLIVDTEETRNNIVDFFGKKEILYLGPDEQVIPEDINWVIQRAAQRNYDTPAAFMSSKPRAGINHKEYGVTSEGVNVYLDVALRKALGIDPTKDTFTVKMTGGPDGDVAGNEINILIREYGSNVKIVGVADHSGCAEDPDGLNHDELLRMVKDGLCISNFDQSRLGPLGAVHTVDNEEGTNLRNSMHNRLVADAFLPCGGRPNTVDIHNYKQFLQPDGKTPSSPLIVEGANLFVTAEARQALFEEAGVLIVKDSSANKGGVITSSYEICAAMLASEEEFFENKDQIVNEVLAKLRNLAKMEATLLFEEFEMYPGSSLPHVSQNISNVINETIDALQVTLDKLSGSDIVELLPLFRSHLPETLADMSFDNVQNRVPEQYIKNAIASCLASKIVYKEGSRFIQSQSKEKLAEIALQYIAKEKEVALLTERLAMVDMPQEEKQKIIQLLEAGGARTALKIF